MPGTDTPSELPDTLSALLSRFSLGIKHLGEPGPNAAQLQALVHAALRAPDHAELVPFRLVAVQGAAREPLATLFEQHARAKGKDDAGVAIERERALKQSGQVTASANPNGPSEFGGADYFLTGKLQSITTKTSQGTSDYVLYSFRLTDARTSEIVWEDSAEIKKQGLEDAAYR